MPWVIPNLYIQHGSHAFTEEDKQETQDVQGVSQVASEAVKPKVYNSNHDYYMINHNPHLGSNIEDVGNHLHTIQDQKESIHNMPEHEKSAVLSYAESSKDINKALIHHDGDLVKAQESSKFINLDHFDSAVNKHTLPKMVLHSGVGWNPRKESSMSNGVFRTSAYTSSSIDSGTADFFAKHQWDHKLGDFERHVLRIHVPEGHKGLFVGNEYNGSPLTHMAEHEVILPRNTTYKLAKNTPSATYYKEGNTVATHVWDAHIVPHGEDPHSWTPPKK